MTAPRRPLPRILALGMALGLMTALASGSARAQVAEGRRALDDAEFTRAIRAFDRAERSEVLDREELIQLYEGRATARWATGAESRARRDLAALASLHPNHLFPAEAPPELAEGLAAALAEAGGPLALHVRFTEDGSGSLVTIEVQHDVASLVRTVRAHIRVGGGPWHVEDALSIPVAHELGVAIEAWVEGIGPGGAIVVTEGSALGPLVHPEPVAVDQAGPRSATEVTPAALAPSSPSSGPDVGLIAGISIGAGVVVVLAVVLGVVFGTAAPSDRTQPSAPIVMGF